jgi:hypothetical protein
MKSLLLATILSVMLLAPALARADASPQGCTSSDNKAKGCDKDPAATVPEPGLAILVASGILAVGGIAVLRRKQQSN